METKEDSSMKLRNYIRKFFVVIGSLAALGIGANSVADIPESDEPIKIVINDWTGPALVDTYCGKGTSGDGLQR